MVQTVPDVGAEKWKACSAKQTELDRHEAGLIHLIAVGILGRKIELDRAGYSMPEWSAT